MIIGQFAFLITFRNPVYGYIQKIKKTQKVQLYQNHLNKIWAENKYLQSIWCDVCAVSMVPHLVNLLHAIFLHFVFQSAVWPVKHTYQWCYAENGSSWSINGSWIHVCLFCWTICVVVKQFRFQKLKTMTKVKSNSL